MCAYCNLFEILVKFYLIKYKDKNIGCLLLLTTSGVKLHSCPKLKSQPVLSFSSFVHNTSINEHKNMKLREIIYFEIINWILYYYSFGNNLKVNLNAFFLKNYVLKKAKILIFFRKEIKWKVVIIMHYCQAEIGILPKIT